MAITFVSAIDSACLPDLLILLRSARDLAKLDMSKMRVYLLRDDGFDETHAKIRSEFPDLDIRDLSLDDPNFDFVRHLYEGGLEAMFFDYVRAYISTDCAPCLWLDTDILLREGFDGFEAYIEARQPEIAMGQDFDMTDEPAGGFHHRMLDYYNRIYDEAVPLVKARSAPEPIKYNCGVLYMARPFEKEWREIFTKVAHLQPPYAEVLDPPPNYGAGAANTFGQGVWNAIFWNLGGMELDKRWNTMKFLEPEARGLLEHYAVCKDVLLKDAERLGLA